MVNLEKHELAALLEAAGRFNKLHQLMILVAYNHGLRASEIVKMTGDQVSGGYLVVQRLKHSLKTIQPLLSNEAIELKERATKIGSGLMFPMSRQWFWQLVQDYGKLAGIPKHKCHPHTLKHSIAMDTIKTAGIENVRQYLGHKSIASTGAYLKVSDDAASKAIAAAIGG